MAGLDAFGVLLERGTVPSGGGDTTYVPIANMGNLEGPETERETYDVSAHDSPDGWREFVGGLKDGGEVTAELNYDPSEHDTLLEDYDLSQPIPWRVTWPTGDKWEFGAILSGFKPEAPVDDKLAAEAKFKVSGKPEIIPAP